MIKGVVSNPKPTKSPTSLFQEDVFIFKEKFHEYIFVDAKGNEYPAVVEFAPYQRMGRTRSKKVDRKCDTYETAAHFLEFIRTMDNEEALPKLELKSDFDAKHDNQIRSTPLLEFLNDKKGRKRDRDRKQAGEKKKILAPIKEDATAKENSRAGRDKANKSQQSQTKDAPAKKERPERSEKEKARRAERDKMRREKRHQLIVDKKKERELIKQQKVNGTGNNTETPKSVLGSGENTNPTVANTSSTKPPAEEKKNASREPRKHGDRRQENRSKQPSTTDPAKAQSSKRQEKPEGDGQKPAEGDKKKESRRYSERRVRNKDRPAIQIYQPGSSSSSSTTKARKPDE